MGARSRYVSMIQPLRSRASARTPHDLVGDVPDAARDEDLVRRADVRAPVDLDRRIRDGAKRAVGVEHDDDVVRIRRPSARQPPARGDQHRPAHAVQRDPVARGEGGDAADPGDRPRPRTPRCRALPRGRSPRSCCRRAPGRPRRETRRAARRPAHPRSPPPTRPRGAGASLRRPRRTSPRRGRARGLLPRRSGTHRAR